MFKAFQNLTTNVWYAGDHQSLDKVYALFICSELRYFLKFLFGNLENKTSCPLEATVTPPAYLRIAKAMAVIKLDFRLFFCT